MFDDPRINDKSQNVIDRGEITSDFTEDIEERFYFVAMFRVGRTILKPDLGDHVGLWREFVVWMRIVLRLFPLSREGHLDLVEGVRVFATEVEDRFLGAEVVETQLILLARKTRSYE